MWQAPHQVADIRNEAEIEHAVGLIEHQHLGMAHVKDVLLEVVDETAGRANEHIDAFFELPALLVVINAAKHDCLPEAAVPAENFRVVVDLHRELACRRDYQGADRGRIATARRGSRQQRLIHRNQERGGLARAGLCLAGNIPAGERQGQCLCLDWSAEGEARIADALHEGRRQGEGFESRGAGVWISHQIVLYHEWVGWPGLANEPGKRYKALKTADFLATPMGSEPASNYPVAPKGPISYESSSFRTHLAS